MKGIFSVIFLFSFFSVFSQAVMQFDKRVHDFGSIKEVDGPVAYDFEFVNTGSSPVLIKNVESSCGCTAPEWTKLPVLPGKRGFIKATFNPKDRPGYFDKTVTVYSNSRTAVVELKIKGTVEGKTRTVLDDYPYELASGLRLPLEDVSFMKIHKGLVKQIQMGVLNNAGKSVSVSFAALPAHLQMSIEPGQIPDKGQAVIKASYHSALHGDFGLNREQVTMLVDGKKYVLPVSVYIEEDFSGVDVATAPVVEVDKKYYNFGQTISAQSATFTFQLKNTGKSPLKVHRIYSNDDRVAAEVARQELKPGETAAVVVKTVVGADKGKVTAVLSVITNSPATPDLKLRFYGEIQ